ncbi:MAG: class I SAM-dependent methyltransferase [Chloroflexi bacterium]|nr:class I SAM-dependent methyltransferase [Chloroflexota bacterium]
MPDKTVPQKVTADYAKISPTAVLVSALRAKYTNMPYAREIYRAVKQITTPLLYTGTGSILSRLARFAPQSMSRVAFIESRYLSVNTLLRNLGDSYAVVEIAAGLSARGLEWAGSKSLYVETDLPDMISIKQQVFDKVLHEKGITQSRNHHFCPLNALDFSDWDRLGQRFFSDGKTNIAVVHEGLASYLSRAEKEKLRDNIGRFFRKYASKGTWITPDFYPYENARKTWILRLIQRRLERKTRTKMHHFVNRDEVMEFFKLGEFQASSRDGSFIFDQVTCISKVPLNREKIRQALSRYQVYQAEYTA